MIDYKCDNSVMESLYVYRTYVSDPTQSNRCGLLRKFTNTLSPLSFVSSGGNFYSLDQNRASMYYMTLSLSFTCHLKLVLHPHNMCC